MKFSIIHPTARVTRGFNMPWWDACHSAFLGCDHPEDCEYIVIVHESRIREFWRDGDYKPYGWGRFTVVTNCGRDCLVDQCNAGQLAAQGEIVVGNQDDMRFPEHWDSEILKLIPDTSERVCVRVDDGARADLIIQTVATKALMDAIGPTSPEYDGMFSDNEFAAKVGEYGRVIPSGLKFQHLHPANGTGKSDSVYEMENREEAYRIGLEVFERRRAEGFPRVHLPGFPGPSPGPISTTPRPVGLGIVRSALNWMDRKLNGGSGIQFEADMMPRPNRKLIVCLPGPDKDRLSCVLRMVEKAESMQMQFSGIMQYTSSPDVTRMVITDAALSVFKGDRLAPYALWIDDDNIVSPEQMGRLIQFMDETPECDILVGWCWIKREGSWQTSVGQFDASMHVTYLTPIQMRENGVSPQHFPMLASGFPCVLMRREVMERLGSKAFVKIQREDFSHGGMGEDYSFFWRAHEAGMKCYVDPLCKVLHIKPEAQEPHLEIPNEMWCDPKQFEDVDGPKSIRDKVNAEAFMRP